MLKIDLKLMVNKGLGYLKKVNVLNYCKKNKITIYDNGKQNPEESYINKYQKHVACSYGKKLACPDDTFSKPFKSYLGQDTAYNFVNSMTKESKYCADIMLMVMLK